MTRVPPITAAFPEAIFDQCFCSPALKWAPDNVRTHIIAVETGHNLVAESDTERVAAVYLHVVNIIIVGTAAFSCSRSDIKFKVNNVLILEYKHSNSLKETERTGDALIEEGRNAGSITGGLPRSVKTALEGGAAIASGQANKYNNIWGCPFDYRSP
ncbi:hypothetical protein P691DRAFT_791405 [Macrolepiota fuliginosa MF-IS2]|uniref:Uncharacterized protein n=1 Tax=Macrolepiota fuliginosa MF-IS2 TaxID=1400762 RepID=A0A9P5XEH7_9AGAR|nr:hypothetical protein P691DRAFT_791405 [Macrolepiota fuliginosa MF-IS2]